MPVSPTRFETPPARLEAKPIAPEPKPKFELKAESPEAQMVGILNKPNENPDQTLEALAHPSKSAMEDFIKPTTVTGVATRLGHLHQQLERRDIPEADRQKITAQLKELEVQLKILAGEAKGLPQEKAEVLENKTNVQLERAESDYLAGNKAKMDGLEARYVDERTDAKYVQKQIEDFAKSSGLQHEETPELKGKYFDTNSRKIIGERVQKHIDTLLNSEQGRKNPEKHKTVTDETNRYLDLISQAQAEGDIPQDLDASSVMQLVEQNVWTLAFQDRVASENLIGDHGIRHLVGHNIRVSESIADELVRNSQPVKAVDRLIMHQVMIDHDLGYAMDPVRLQINKGEFKADKGHNVLSAKYERQRIEDKASPLSQIFSGEQLSVIHEGVLNHDSSYVDFHIGDSSEAARRDNINSTIHTADNTHAFEDKLPELLYTHPDTLRVMRLMKTAGEIGDQESFQKLQVQLVQDIQSNPNYSTDDRGALTQAVHSLRPDSYQFLVGRICGNKPEYAMDSKGGMTISVQESKIHQEVVGLYGQDSYDQLKKFVGDLTGQNKKDVDLSRNSIQSTNGKLEIKIRIGEQKSAEGVNDYQRRIEQLVADSSFQEFIIGDGRDNSGDMKLATHQTSLQAELKQQQEGAEMYNRIAAKIDTIKSQRRENLHRYLDKQT